MKEQASPDLLYDLLDRLRRAARSGTSALLRPSDVLLLMSDELYPMLARIEAGRFPDPTTETNCDTPHVQRPRDIHISGDTNVPSVEELIAEWLKFHVSLLAAPDRYHYSVRHLITFFAD